MRASLAAGQDKGAGTAFALTFVSVSSFRLPAKHQSWRLALTHSTMTEEEYEALYEALEAAHKILPGGQGLR